MNSSYLNEFLVVVRHMNFTAAAKYLNLTQSSLSKHMAALEKEFGCTLFKRNLQGIELTSQGRVFSIDAQKMLNLYDEAKRHVRSATREVRLAGSIEDDAMVRLVSEAKAYLAAHDPGFTLSLAHCGTQSPFDQLASRQIDLFVEVALQDEETDPRCDSCILATVPLVAIVSRQHPLADREAISVHDLEGRLVVHPIGGLGFARGTLAVDEFFRRHGVVVEQELIFADSTRDFSFSNLEESILVTPRSNFSKRLFPGLLDDYLPLPIEEPDAAFPYHLIWRKNEQADQITIFREVLLNISESICPINAHWLARGRV